MSGNQLSV